ncbi:MAG: endonuclease III [Chloroflexota bacterium]
MTGHGPSGLEGAADKARWAHACLAAHYGEPRPKERYDPLSELVMTILSQNTNDTNSGRAYEALRQRYPTWEDVLAAPTHDLAAAIHVGGLANVKAPRIQRILAQVESEHGRLTLDALADLSPDEARRYLLSLPGVGPKTAACVLLFSLEKPALPVDTHVHRVALRLGLIPRKAGAEQAHALLEALLPPEAYYTFHLLMIQHGRTLCKAARPLCDACPLATDCDHLCDQSAPPLARSDASPGADASPRAVRARRGFTRARGSATMALTQPAIASCVV